LNAEAAQLLHHIRRLAAAPQGNSASDAELLERFARHHDADAFAALVGRHGPMVLRVCHRVLADSHAAEDCFQATFLILARKAASVRGRESLTGWLYVVACRLAHKARAASTRRQPREAPGAEEGYADPRPDPLAELTARELLAAVDEEVQQLPQAYRLPVILCCLEGRTREEAARLLGCTQGSLKGRLERGRSRLHAQLVRRGLTLGAALAAVEVSRVSAVAVPGMVGDVTVRAGLAIAAGRTAEVPARVVALAEGSLKGMAVAKVKVGVALLLATAVVGALAQQAPNQKQSQPPQEVESRLPLQGTRPKAPADRYGDPLPEGAFARLGTLRFRQGGGQINRLLLSPDGKIAVSKSYYGEGSVAVWDLASGKLLQRLPGHYDENRAVALSPDGKTLVIGQGNRLHFFDPASGREVRRLEGPDGDIQGLAFSPDGRNLASGHEGAFVHLWDLASGKPRVRLSAKHNRLGLLAFSPDGKTLATGDTLDPTFRLFDVATAKERHTITRPSYVRDFAFAPDRALLAVGGQDGVITLWDPISGKLIRELRCPNKHIWAVAFSPDGKTLATGEFDEKGETGYIRLWDPAAGKERLQFRSTWGAEHCLAFTPDGKTLVSGGGDSIIHLWDPASGEECSPVKGHEVAVWCLALSPDGKTLAYSGQGVRLWDLAIGREVGVLPGHHWSFVFSPDGKYMAGGSGVDVIHVWDVAQRKLVRKIQMDPKKEHLQWVAYYHVAFSPDGKMLAASGRGLSGPAKTDVVVQLWDFPSLKEQGRLHCSGADTFCTVEGGLTFSPDRRILAASGRTTGSSKVWLWDVATRTELTLQTAAMTYVPEENPEGHLQSSQEPWVAFSPDGRLLAMSRAQAGMPVWETRTGRERCRLTGHKGVTTHVAFSPDGRTLASAGWDGTIRLWDLAKGEELRRLTGHRGHASDLVFLPDGKTLISGGSDTTVLFWDVAAITSRAQLRGRFAGGEPEALWTDLVTADAVKAHKAIARLAASPEAVAMLKGHLRPISAPDATHLAKLVRELDADDFGVREKARQELERLGEAARGALQRERERVGVSLEVRRRLDSLLEQLQVPSGDSLGELRALEVLERMATPEAVRLLQAVALGTSEARLTKEAQASLERLTKRAADGP
jgi:RNA polymerase sigma factor (sigma-70 family)